MALFNKGIYMAGTPIHTKYLKYDKNNNLYPGVYIVKITQNILPNEKVFYCEKTENGNNWECENKEITTLMTVVDYEQIIKEKISRKENPWTLSIIDGYYTENSIKGCDLFACILPFLQEKTRQDGLPSHLRNDAMRNTCKTVMNSLSGKFLQAASDLEYFFNSITGEIEKRNLCDEEYTKNLYSKDKYIYIGLYIYSLSKIYMYNYGYGIFTKDEFIYTDTDSIKIGSKQVFDKWYNNYGKLKIKDLIFPECMDMKLGYDDDTEVYYNGNSKKIKCIGQFEDELHGKNHDTGLFCDKKEYMTYDSRNKYGNGKKAAKILLKGVNQRQSMLYEDIPNTFQFGEKKYTKSDIIKIIEKKDSIKYTINKLFYEDETLYNGFCEYIKEVNKDDRYVIDKCEKILSDKMSGKNNLVIGCIFKREIIKTSVRIEIYTKLI
jgi:hypothetical protein